LRAGRDGLPVSGAQAVQSVAVLPMVFALGAAISWGVSDFLGGVTTRRLPLVWVLLFTQFVGLAIVLPFAAARGAPLLDTSAILAAMAGSLSGLVGIAGLYRAIALGVGSVAAPISATGAALPVAFGLARGEPTTPLQEIGMAMHRRDAPALILVGCLDQLANVLYGFASTLGLVSLSAVLASLYPMVTVILARLVLDERISRVQKSGVALALTGVALVAGR
jgi:drug/metabolite transporter (DMT)-like permease